MKRLVAGLVAAAACTLALAPTSPAAYRHVRTFGRPGSGPGEFGTGVLGGGANRQYDDPAGIAVADDGGVFVVDTSNNRVQEFSPTGAFRNAFGTRGRDNGAIRRVIAIQQGIPIEAAKEIVKYMKEKKLKKVQATIQADQVRVSSPSKDDLQDAMRELRDHDFGVALQFGNYR